MVVGTLLVCRGCAASVEILGEIPVDKIQAADLRCTDCGAQLELDDIPEIDRLAAYGASAVSFAARGG